MVKTKRKRSSQEWRRAVQVMRYYGVKPREATRAVLRRYGHEGDFAESKEDRPENQIQDKGQLASEVKPQQHTSSSQQPPPQPPRSQQSPTSPQRSQRPPTPPPLPNAGAQPNGGAQSKPNPPPRQTKNVTHKAVKATDLRTSKAKVSPQALLEAQLKKAAARPDIEKTEGSYAKTLQSSGAFKNALESRRAGIAPEEVLSDTETDEEWAIMQ